MGLEFVAIDFETANFDRGSPCAVGIAYVQNARVVVSESVLMRPPECVDYFKSYNVMLHGITEVMVSQSKRFAEVFSLLLDAVNRDYSSPIFVAHNASFDMGVIRAACDHSDIERPTMQYMCSLVLSRTHLNLPSYALPSVATALGIKGLNHHNPESDAVTAAEIVLHIAKELEVDSLTELSTKQKILIGKMGPRESIGSKKEQIQHHSLPTPNPQAKASHPLFGKKIVITGYLPSQIPRADALEAAAQLGSIPQEGVRSDTDILVVGDYASDQLTGAVYKTAKVRKAMAMREKGSKIELLGADMFIELLMT